MRWLAVLLALGGTLAACGPAPETPEARARRLESQVWSPYCAGRLLVDCTTQQAEQLRGQILDRLRRGEPEDRVLAWLRANYGDEVLAGARPGALGIVVWLVPGLALGGGAAALATLLRRWSRRGPPPAPPGPSTPDPWIERVRQELDREP